MVVGNILYNMIIPSTPECRKWHKKGRRTAGEMPERMGRLVAPRFVGLFGRVERGGGPVGSAAVSSTIR